jgi:hypothetical protein
MDALVLCPVLGNVAEYMQLRDVVCLAAASRDLRRYLAGSTAYCRWAEHPFGIKRLRNATLSTAAEVQHNDVVAHWKMLPDVTCARGEAATAVVPDITGHGLHLAAAGTAAGTAAALRVAGADTRAPGAHLVCAQPLAEQTRLDACPEGWTVEAWVYVPPRAKAVHGLARLQSKLTTRHKAARAAMQQAQASAHGLLEHARDPSSTELPLPAVLCAASNDGAPASGALTRAPPKAHSDAGGGILAGSLHSPWEDSEADFDDEEETILAAAASALSDDP